MCATWTAHNAGYSYYNNGYSRQKKTKTLSINESTQMSYGEYKRQQKINPPVTTFGPIRVVENIKNIQIRGQKGFRPTYAGKQKTKNKTRCRTLDSHQEHHKILSNASSESIVRTTSTKRMWPFRKKMYILSRSRRCAWSSNTHRDTGRQADMHTATMTQLPTLLPVEHAHGGGVRDIITTSNWFTATRPTVLRNGVYALCRAHRFDHQECTTGSTVRTQSGCFVSRIERQTEGTTDIQKKW